MPIRRVTFLDGEGRPIRPAPSRLAPAEREAQGPPQERLVEFGESNAPAPRTASVRGASLPAQVGAAQALKGLRSSNALRDAQRPRRARRRPAKRRPARRAKARTGSRPRRTARRAARRTAAPRRTR